MSAQLFLIAPPELAPDRLAAVLADVEAAAVLLRRGGLAENVYKGWVGSLLPIAQSAGCAVLIEGEPGWVRLLKADGIHVSGPVDAIREAVDSLKPGHIVGADATRSRHEAMERGELDVDYLLFGPLSGAAGDADADNAAWWAEVMEVPAVFSDPQSAPDLADPHGCEFLALSDNLWEASVGPAKAALAFAHRLEGLQ